MVTNLERSVAPWRRFTQDNPLEEFLAMTDAELANCQVKLTYIGEQRKPLPTVVVVSNSAEGNYVAGDQVLRMKVAGLDFSNDELTPTFSRTSSSEIGHFIRRLAGFPSIANATALAKYDASSSGKYLSLSLFNAIDDRTYCLQAVLGQTDARPLLDAMGRTLGTDDTARRALYILWRGLGFHVGVLDPDSDGDGASDGREASWGTDPHSPDSDRDGICDGDAILLGLDPLNSFRDPEPKQLLQIAEGAFAGSRVVDVRTSPDYLQGEATLEFRFQPTSFLPDTDNLVFIQIFRRTAVKADGFRIPILPSLYIEYAGSPELDMHTVDGATIDHKVGELDPFYNGRDPQDYFAGAGDRQKAGSITAGQAVATSMVYHCRTYEEHWRALNPEGIKEVQFDYETAVFCENGAGRGNFIGTIRWAWGKERGGSVRAWLTTRNVAVQPTARVEVDTDHGKVSLSMFRTYDEGQPSAFFQEVLSRWLRNHKYPWPGQEVEVDPSISLIIPQPVAVPTRICVAACDVPPDVSVGERGMHVSHFAREIQGFDEAGNRFPWDYYPFRLPLTLTFRYNAEDVSGIEPDTIGVARFAPDRGCYTTDGLYVLRKDPARRTITVCTNQFGILSIVGR